MLIVWYWTIITSYNTFQNCSPWQRMVSSPNIAYWCCLLWLVTGLFQKHLLLKCWSKQRHCRKIKQRLKVTRVILCCTSGTKQNCKNNDSLQNQNFSAKQVRTQYTTIYTLQVIFFNSLLRGSLKWLCSSIQLANTLTKMCAVLFLLH